MNKLYLIEYEMTMDGTFKTIRWRKGVVVIRADSAELAFKVLEEKLNKDSGKSDSYKGISTFQVYSVEELSSRNHNAIYDSGEILYSMDVIPQD